MPLAIVFIKKGIVSVDEGSKMENLSKLMLKKNRNIFTKYSELKLLNLVVSVYCICIYVSDLLFKTQTKNGVAF